MKPRVTASALATAFTTPWADGLVGLKRAIQTRPTAWIRGGDTVSRRRALPNARQTIRARARRDQRLRRSGARFILVPAVRRFGPSKAGARRELIS